MQRKLLQIAFTLAGLAAVGFGLAGVVFGTSLMDMPHDVVIDSYVRFLKGMTLGVGLVYWSAIPAIERHGERISVVTFILVLGAVPRLISVILHGVPTLGIVVGLIGELVIVPLLWLWHRQVANAADPRSRV